MPQFSKNEDVLFQNKKTYIFEVYKKNKYCIVNPDWDWDDEAQCVHNEVPYDVPFYLVVKGSEIKKIE